MRFEGFEGFEGLEGFDTGETLEAWALGYSSEAECSEDRLLDNDKYFIEQNSNELRLETTRDKSLYVYRKGIKRIILEINRPEV